MKHKCYVLMQDNVDHINYKRLPDIQNVNHHLNRCFAAAKDSCFHVSTSIMSCNLEVISVTLSLVQKAYILVCFHVSTCVNVLHPQD